MSIQVGPDIINDGLVLQLDAANPRSYIGSGTVWNDLSGNNNTGSLVNGPTFTSTNKGEISFDGSNDSVTIYNIPDSYWLGNWTVSFWANWSVIDTTGADRPLLHQGISGPPDRGLHLTQRSSVLYFGLYSDDLPGSKVLSANTWYHCTFSLNNTTKLQKIYVNSILDASRTSNGSYIGFGKNTTLGAPLLGFGLYFQGKMSSIVGYSRILSDFEIKQNYNATKGRFGL